MLLHCNCILQIYEYSPIHIRANVFICIFIRIHMCICIRICARACICTRARTRIRLCMCIFMCMLSPFDSISLTCTSARSKLILEICISPELGVNQPRQWRQVGWMIAKHNDGRAAEFNLRLILDSLVCGLAFNLLGVSSWDSLVRIFSH